MNLYRILQDENKGDGTFDSAIVAAIDRSDARKTHPDSKCGWRFVDNWCDPYHVKVELIGVAKYGTEAGVILASFNAGR